MDNLQIELQSQLTFMHRVLRAIVKSHPNPDGLLEEWQVESSEALAHLGIQEIRLDSPENVNDAFQRAFHQWNLVIREQVIRSQ